MNLMDLIIKQFWVTYVTNIICFLDLNAVILPEWLKCKSSFEEDCLKFKLLNFFGLRWWLPRPFPLFTQILCSHRSYGEAALPL